MLGLELAGSRPCWLGREVALIGDAGLARSYRAGLALSGFEAETRDATAMTLAGMVAARSGLAR